jgi:hypothetical protein
MSSPLNPVSPINPANMITTPAQEPQAEVTSSPAEVQTTTEAAQPTQTKQETSQSTTAVAPAPSAGNTTTTQQQSVPKGKVLVPGFGIVLSLELLNKPIQQQQIQLNDALEYQQELPYELRGNQEYLFELINNGNGDNFFNMFVITLNKFMVK